MELSPAEAYAAHQRRVKEAGSPLGRYAAELDYELDDFQQTACLSLQAGKSVLVAAPTGAGKTVVAQFAVRLAFERGVRAFYTTPIKALSNQKFQELCEEYGEDNVGLLTGDTTIRRDAKVIVMTTEVLRNMIYSGTDLSKLGFVVLDEVHYLGDRFRGPVWEEVIIHLPMHVALVSLSATVSNAEEFGDWLAEVRGDTDVIVSEHRPVPLYNHVAVGTNLYPLFAPGKKNAHKLNRDLTYATQKFTRRPTSRRDRRNPRQMRFRRPSRTSLISELLHERLLPAIYFIFSRSACDDAVEQCLAAGLDLTTSTQKRHIRARLEDLQDELAQEDLGVLGFHSFATGMIHGFAAHHAGLIPQFKELVEELFAAGHLHVVFATETLALGINMPARTVVLEKLTKFNGESHVQITPGEYTQLTGRAGRRGIDIEGHAVVVWHPTIEPEEIQSLASKRTYALRSQFTPTYNMAANLLARMTKDDAAKVLETSFAQFQADRGVVGLAKKLRRNEEAMAGYERSMECEAGDFMSYAQLRRTLSTMEKKASRYRSKVKQRDVVESLAGLQPGDVIVLPSHKFSEPAVVIQEMQSQDGTSRLPTILTSFGKVWHLRPHEVTEPAQLLGHIRMPRKFNHRQVAARRQVIETMEAAFDRGQLTSPKGKHKTKHRPQRSGEAEIDEVRQQLRAHPCHSCPERENHARWAERLFKLQQETAQLRKQISGRTSSIAHVFDRVCSVLTALHFLPDDSRILRRIYGERDLLAAMSVRAGLWDELTEPEAAGLASALCYQSRREGGWGMPPMPTAGLHDAAGELRGLWADLFRLETDFRLPPTPEPDFGLVQAIFRWTEGKNLSGALAGSDVAAGDFVRWAKQTLDMLGQIADVCPPAVEPTVRRAADAIRRGVVADS
ncbi:DEAD/DEAH box helicase [Brevibacterium luteolum]|uniref:DEAD/DEAH box helicase n=1 Tax=Brevibacterium luteolum TaxID=199591 RepID=UPI0021AE7665|nr:DEAD/DEAH box helicase [Brevibacterium luteolum]MCT1830710.1 DEAD/DEAH box helicase [Brevibacterium luteolum]